MLWQKKKVKGELVYGKLMTKDEQKMFSEETDEKLRDILIEKLFKRKGNALALKSRQQANGLFKSGNFREAIGVYNHTLTYTENHTADLGLCYANRAASFLKLNQYSLCLADIELAKKNKYPARLMPKLDRRQIECETLLAANGDAYLERSEPKLSFEADPKIPCFAKGLEVKFSEKYGKYITTNCDLEIGQTIIVERAFVFEATDTFYLHCEYCLKRTTNLIPCENCVIAMFCSENCRVAANAKFHDVLCDIQTFCEKSPQQILLLQSMIIAIRTFSTVAALMAAVERFRATNGNSTTDFNDPTKRDYFQFFNLRSNVVELTAHERNELKKKALEVIEIMKSSISLQSMFRTRKIAQFLSHLAVHHMQIITFNTYNASHAVCCPYESVLGIKECTLGTSYGIGLVPYSSQVSHSCAPNICRIFLNDTVVHKVLRQIKSGDQLFITYLEPIKLMIPRLERAVELGEKYRLVCDCISCESNSPPFKASGKETIDSLSKHLLALLDGVPDKRIMKILDVTAVQTLIFEMAAINYLRTNDHLHPTLNTMKIQFLLAQIWFLLIR